MKSVILNIAGQTFDLLYDSRTDCIYFDGEEIQEIQAACGRIIDKGELLEIIHRKLNSHE